MKPTWTDPRAIFGKDQDPSKWVTNVYADPHKFVEYVQKEMRDMRMQVEEVAHEMTQLKGFYSWLMHAYPDTIVQYKAIQELQKATQESTVEEKVPMYAFGSNP